jgi:hypothetical protein
MCGGSETGKEKYLSSASLSAHVLCLRSGLASAQNTRSLGGEVRENRLVNCNLTSRHDDGGSACTGCQRTDDRRRRIATTHKTTGPPNNPAPKAVISWGRWREGLRSLGS